MRISTLIGVILGFVAILGAFYLERGDFTRLVTVSSLLIVVGGTLMAGLASTSWKIFSKMFKLIGISFFPPHYDKRKITFQIIEYSLIARKHGMLALENKLNSAVHPYIRKIFQSGIDGADAETLEEVFAVEVEGMTFRHSENIALFQKLGALSPTMGITGAVIGLIITMGEAGADGGDANTLIQSIGVAFLATLWGIMLANVFWIPIGDKLQLIHNEEVQLLELIFDGAKCVLNGETPLLIISKLESTFPLSEQQQFHRDAKKFIENNKSI